MRRLCWTLVRRIVLRCIFSINLSFACAADSGDEIVVSPPKKEKKEKAEKKKKEEEKRGEMEKKRNETYLPMGVVLSADAEKLARLLICKECCAGGPHADFLYASSRCCLRLSSVLIDLQY